MPQPCDHLLFKLLWLHMTHPHEQADAPFHRGVRGQPARQWAILAEILGHRIHNEDERQ